MAMVQWSLIIALQKHAKQAQKAQLVAYSRVLMCDLVSAYHEIHIAVDVCLFNVPNSLQTNSGSILVPDECL